MKPWLTLLNKAPSQGGEKGGQRERERERTQVRAKSTQTQRGSQRGKGVKIMFQSPHQLQEAYQRRKGKRNLEQRSKFMFQSLQSPPQVARNISNET